MILHCGCSLGDQQSLTTNLLRQANINPAQATSDETAIAKYEAAKAYMATRGVTKVDLLSPTIFNEVVDAVVSHWVTVMVSGAEEWGERGQEGRHQNALLCVDDGMVASSDPRWI